MTYRQSLETIEKLKKIVWPYTNEWTIFFKFKNKTEFEIIFLDSSKKSDDIIKEYLRTLPEEVPFAHMSTSEPFAFDMPSLCYMDAHIMYEANIMTGDIRILDFMEPSNQCSAQIKLDMLKLVRKLKNM